MDDIARGLASNLVNRLCNADARARLLVGVAGIPASGKSTLAKLVVVHCNKALSQSQSSTESGTGKAEAILVGLDGWHLTRAQLDALPDPKLAHDRRGAHWTFDGKSYSAFVAALRQPLPAALDQTSDSTKDNVIKAPTFDHAAKDPEFDAISILPSHRIVVIEGLYTFLSIGPWREAGLLLDERWFIDIGVEEASRRLVKRHVLTGVTKDMEEAIWRAEQNDIPNGRFIIENMLAPTRHIPSVDDPVFVNDVVHAPEPQ